MDSRYFPTGVRIAVVPRASHEMCSSFQDVHNSLHSQHVIVNAFERFLRTAMLSEALVAFRIHNHPNAQFVGYLSTSETYNEALRSAFVTQFPDFETRFERKTQPPSVAEGFWIGHPTGIPVSIVSSLNGAVHTLLHSESSSFYQATAVPHSTKGVTMRARRCSDRRRYESGLERAERQIEDTSILGRGSKRKVNADAPKKSKRYERNYQRLCADYVFSTNVTLAFWGSPSSRSQLTSAVNSLLAAISSEDREERIKVKYSHGKKAIRLFQDAYALRLAQPSTLLSPREDVPCFQIPTIELGLTQTNPAQFSTSSTLSLKDRNQNASIPFREGSIGIGQVYRLGNLRPDQVKYLELQTLKCHVLIVGTTDTGKSSTKNRIVMDLWRNKILSLLIEPVKEAARAARDAREKGRSRKTGTDVKDRLENIAWSFAQEIRAMWKNHRRAHS